MSVWTTAGLIADGSFDDPENARIIYIAAGGLVLLAALLGVGTWLWWRSAKVEHPALAPLEVMSTRRWWKGDFTERRRRLDEVRPTKTDAAGLEAAVAAPVDLDQVMVREDPHSFDDLLDPVAADLLPADPVGDEAEAVPAVEPEAEVAAEAEPESEAVEPESVEPADEPESVEPADESDVEDAVAAEAAVVATVDEPADEQPRLTFEPVAAAPRSIVIDTAPRPRDAPSDLGPESVDSDPTPAPIDPLLRLQAE